MCKNGRSWRWVEHTVGHSTLIICKHYAVNPQNWIKYIVITSLSPDMESTQHDHVDEEIVWLSRNNTFQSLIVDCFKTNFSFCYHQTCLSNSSIPNTTEYRLTDLCFVSSADTVAVCCSFFNNDLCLQCSTFHTTGSQRPGYVLINVNVIL